MSLTMWFLLRHSVRLLILLAGLAWLGQFRVRRVEGQWRAYFQNLWGLAGALFGYGLGELLLNSH